MVLCDTHKTMVVLLLFFYDGFAFFYFVGLDLYAADLIYVLNFVGHFDLGCFVLGWGSLVLFGFVVDELKGGRMKERRRG